MKRHFLFSLALVAASLLPLAAHADDSWDIKSFHADITVQKDSVVDVKETIVANFNDEHHGIFRDIPVKYQNTYGQNISIGLEMLGVTDEKGEPYQYALSQNGAYKEIKIGDPDQLITGEHTYVIHYHANRELRYFNDHDELYWNVTGNDWQVPLVNVTATVNLPFTQTEGVKAICFTGDTGSTTQECTSKVAAGKVSFTADDFLTVGVSWPKGLVTAPSSLTTFGWFVADSWGVVLPFLAFTIGYFIWSRYGRDPKGRGVVRQYDAPDKLSPAEVGCLVKQNFRNEFISAEIVYLAEKGYLLIREVKTKGFIKDSIDYELEKKKDWSNDTSVKGHQKQLLDGLFSGSETGKIMVSSLKDSFYLTVTKIQASVWDQLKSAGYFPSNPATTVAYWMSGVFVAGFLLFGLVSLTDWRVDVLLGAIIAVAILMVFAILMPKRTEKGVAAWQYALGFKQYIAAAETERIKFEEKENLFFEVLPYAMIFGIGAKWAKAFEGLSQQPPQWYQGNSFTTFSPVRFTNNLSSFSSASVASFSPPRSSSSGFGGGGFSGGGGGGGGGGAW